MQMQCDRQVSVMLYYLPVKHEIGLSRGFIKHFWISFRGLAIVCRGENLRFPTNNIVYPTFSTTIIGFSMHIARGFRAGAEVIPVSGFDASRCL